MAAPLPIRMDLPPAPVVAGLSECALAPADVTVTLRNGKSLRARLLAVDYGQEILLVRAGRPTRVLRVEFRQLAMLVFKAPIPVTAPQPDGEALPLSTRPPEPSQPYELRVTGVGVLMGRMRTAVQDAAGLHLFRLVADDSAQRIFIPQGALESTVLGEPLGQRLLAQRSVNDDELTAALARQAQARTAHGMAPVPRLGEQLVTEGVASEADVQRALASKAGVPFVALDSVTVTEEALARVPLALAQKHQVLPIRLVGGHLLVAVRDAFDKEALDTIRFVANLPVDVVLAAPGELQAAIEKHYGPVTLHKDIEDAEQLQKVFRLDKDQQSDLLEAERATDGAPVVRLVAKLIQDAIRQRASDIHVRPGEHDVDLLFRIDGTLVRQRTFSKSLLPSVVSRIKILGRMDIAERRLPQDGRAQMVEGGQAVDLRISVIPTVNGESAVIRLLNAQAGLKDIRELGFTPADAEAFTDMLQKSYGLILVTGPTGSGKSTTLYAALKEVISRNLNIITVEDPVEYHIEGIQQIQVNTAPGFTFARALRNILRHDPDAIMIGEIRDVETGKIAIESALTGHLVLSTLHTNDAPGAVTRILEMGVDPFLLNGTLLGVFAQRLARRNCTHCLTDEHPDPMVYRALHIPDTETFRKGAGCEHCNGTGLKGRVAVYELLRMTADLRSKVHATVSVDEIREQAVKDGMVPLTQNALQLARQGVIPLAEVYRVRLE